MPPRTARCASWPRRDRSIPVGAPIAWIGADAPDTIVAPESSGAVAAPAVGRGARDQHPGRATTGRPSEIGMPVVARVTGPRHARAPRTGAAAGTHPDGSRIIASPLARQLARDAGIDLAGSMARARAAASSAPTSTPHLPRSAGAPAAAPLPARCRLRRRPGPRRPRPVTPVRSASASASRPRACSARSRAGCTSP